MLPIALAVIVLLNLLSSYTCIHILLGTAIACVLAGLVAGPMQLRKSPKESCVRLSN